MSATLRAYENKSLGNKVPMLSMNSVMSNKKVKKLAKYASPKKQAKPNKMKKSNAVRVTSSNMYNPAQKAAASQSIQFSNWNDRFGNAQTRNN